MGLLTHKHKNKERKPSLAIKQHPIPQEAEKGIQKQTDQYLAERILEDYVAL